MRPVIEIAPGELISRIRKNVPQELRDRPQWCLWKIGGGRKLPLSHRGGYASCTDPDTWATFEVAARVFLHNAHVCRGFNFACGDGLGGLDLDGVVAADGSMSPMMTLFLGHLNSYTELSPSGTGLRVFFLYEEPHENRKAGAVELYFNRHFLSVTGDLYQGRDRLAVADVGAERILTALRPRKPLLPRLPVREVTQDDNELLEKMFRSKSGHRIHSLWCGETQHKSASESDMALMSHLAYWTAGDTERMIRLFLSSGRAERAKGRRQDYLSRMAKKAADWL